MKITIPKSVFLLFAFAMGSVNAMTPMDNNDLELVVGQGLIVSETIQGSGDWSEFTYTRMGLDARVSLNANIDKLQLGCGGFNESILSNACDIDFDFVNLMGRNGNQPGAVGSDFVMTRPYVEIATVGTGTTREIAGIKIGAQTTNGYMGVGRRYENGQVNQENGGTCGSNAGNQALACHSGINTISGYLHAEMSGQVDVEVSIFGNETACFGNTSFTNDDCGAGDAFYRDLVGTRMEQIRAPSIPLKLDGGFLSAIGISDAYANLTEAYRFIHGFALADTSDFGLSFQRQRLAWPGYDKTTFSYPANAGWWLNVPDVKAMDIQGAPISLGLGEAIDALGEPGVALTNIELNYTPPDNCWGSSRFC